MLDENDVECGIPTHYCIACNALRCWKNSAICVWCIDQGVNWGEALVAYYERFRTEQIADAFKHTGKGEKFRIILYAPVEGEWIFQSQSYSTFQLEGAREAIINEWNRHADPVTHAQKRRYKVVVEGANVPKKLAEFFP